MAELFGELGFKEGVEVGTRQGHYAMVLCDSNPHLHLTCVDPWNRRHQRFYEEAVSNLSTRNVTIMRTTSMEAVGQFNDGSLDFVYIDADHSFDNAMLDTIHWVPKVRVGGIVALHDYCTTVAGVTWAVNAYTHCHHIDPWYTTREAIPTAFWVQR